MTLRSAKGFFERTAPGSLRTDKPCDAGYVWTAMDNIAHMIDVSPKYRINFLNSGFTGLTVGGSRLTDGDSSSAFYFTTDLPDGQTYPGYDIRVAFYGSQESGDLDVRVSLVLPSVQAPVTDATPGVLATFTGTVASAAYAWTIDELVPAQDVTGIGTLPFERAPNADGSTADVGSVVWLKLLIEDTGDGSEDGSTMVVGVQVRELST